MWLHLVQILVTAINRYLFRAAPMVKTELFKSAHIFNITFSKCLHLMFNVVVGVSLSSASSLAGFQRLNTAFLENLEGTLHPCLLHWL